MGCPQLTSLRVRDGWPATRGERARAGSLGCLRCPQGAKGELVPGWKEPERWLGRAGVLGSEGLRWALGGHPPLTLVLTFVVENILLKKCAWSIINVQIRVLTQ